MASVTNWSTFSSSQNMMWDFSIFPPTKKEEETTKEARISIVKKIDRFAFSFHCRVFRWSGPQAHDIVQIPTYRKRWIILSFCSNLSGYICIYLDSTDICSVLFLLNVLSLLRNLYSCIINNSYHGNNCIVPNRPAFDNYYGRKNTKWAIWVNIMYSTPAFSMRLNLKRPYFECLIWKKLNTQLSFYLTKSFGF